MGFPSDIGQIIKTMKWVKFYKNPNPYNVQMVRGFYTNLMDTTDKRLEVVVRGTKEVYSEETINMVLGLNNVGDTYQHILETSDEYHYDVYMESVCNPVTRCINLGLEKTVKRMDLRPDSNVWYQFINNSLCPSVNNETISKARLVLLHYITSFSIFNETKIILQ